MSEYHDFYTWLDKIQEITSESDISRVWAVITKIL